MINKNLKKLSLLLILAVLLIGAVNVVSAENVGVSQATVAPTATAEVTQNVTTAEGIVAGYVITDGPSVGTGGTVPTGTGVSNGTLVFNGNVYTSNGTLLSNGSVDTSSSLSFNSGGTGLYAGTLKINDLTSLTNGETYYAGLTLINGKATYEPVPGTVYESDVGTNVSGTFIQTLYIPFTYYAKYVIDMEDKVVIYGQTWNYTGTISNRNGAIPIGIVNLTFTKGTETKSILVPFTNGTFTLYSTNPALTTNPLTTGAYTITATYDNDFSNTANFYVTGQNITINPSINNTNAYYNDPSTITTTLTDATGNLFTDATTITYTIINLNTGTRTTLTGYTTTGKDSQKLEGLVPGSYVIRINAINSNFNFAQVDTYYNVIAVPTVISTSEYPLVVVNKGNGTITIKIQDSEGNDLDVSTNNINVMLFDSTNVPKTTIQHPDADNQYTLDSALVSNGDYLKISFAQTGYTSSELSVPVIIKNGTKVLVSPTSVTYTYSANQTVAIMLLDSSNNLLPLNTTVDIVLNNTIATVQLTNGVAAYGLQNLNLGAEDEAYTLSVVYPGDDTYKSSEGNITVKVNPVYELGLLKANTSIIQYNVTSDEILKLNLTSLSDTSQLVPFTGILTYTLAGENYEVSMIEGQSFLKVGDLEGLTSGNNSLMFKILGNNRSNQVPVVIIVNPLNATLNVENITAYNDTNFNVSGTITNAADGTVSVILTNDKGESIAAYRADVNKDGSFVAPFTPVANGNYTAEVYYNDDGNIGVSNPEALYDEITIFVNGTAGPTPTPPSPTGNISTILVIDSFSEIVDAGKNLTGRLLAEDGTPIVGMHILLNLTRLSNGQSKVYYTTTDYLGEFQFPINLAVGDYTAYATFGGVTIPTTNVTYAPTASNVTPFYVLSNGTDPNETNTSNVIITATPYVGVSGSPGNFTVKFTLLDGTPIVGVRDVIEITLTRTSSGASKTYTWFVPDYKGEVTLPIELGTGEYAAHIVYKGSTVPIVTSPATADSTVTVL